MEKSEFNKSVKWISESGKVDIDLIEKTAKRKANSKAKFNFYHIQIDTKPLRDKLEKEGYL